MLTSYKTGNAQVVRRDLWVLDDFESSMAIWGYLFSAKTVASRQLYGFNPRLGPALMPHWTIANGHPFFALVFARCFVWWTFGRRHASEVAEMWRPFWWHSKPPGRESSAKAYPRY